MLEMKLIEGTQEERNQYIERVDVLDKVKELNTLAGTEYMTTNQVAEFYEVESYLINKTHQRNKDEFDDDGVKYMGANEILDSLDKVSNDLIEKHQGGIRIDGNNVVYASNKMFPKRAVLRVGMLLRDSPVAKEVRTLLLNVYHDVEQGKENILENINKDYENEERLQKELAKSFMSGDMENFSMAAVKITNLLNKRIDELKPKADYTDEVLMSDGLLTTTQIAKDYGMSARALNGILHGLGVQYKQSGQWLLYSRYQDQGYTSSVTYLLDNDMSVTSTRWTQKGREFIHSLLRKEGLA